jgi:pimeloyl-ACP methyl ester carboxylesterase
VANLEQRSRADGNLRKERGRVPPMSSDEYKYIEANGVRFAYLEAGSGPLVLCFHGFPDSPHTFDRLLSGLAGLGYHAVAPATRGIYPSGIPPGKDYSPFKLGQDVIALIDAFGQRSAIVIGHDWGALASYVAANLAPTRIGKLITIAIPHPRAIPANPKMMLRGWHFALFSIPYLAETIARRKDFALVFKMQRAWSPAIQLSRQAINSVKSSYSHPGSFTAALAYYRALALTFVTMTKSARQSRRYLFARTSVPTLCCEGLEDGVFWESIFDKTPQAFTGYYKLVKFEHGGHSLHLEVFPEFFQSVKEFLGPAAELESN